MAERSGKAQRGIQIFTALLLCGMLGFFAVYSVFYEMRGGAEHSPLWKWLLHEYDRVVLLLGRDSIGDVYVTKNRLLHKKTDYDSDQLAENAEKINAFAEQSDVPVYLLAVPTAAAIYYTELSANVPQWNQTVFLQNVKAQLSDKVNWIESAHWLSAEREQYIYYRTDSRWTSYGAYCVYRTAIRRLGFSALGYDQFQITHFCDDFYGDLSESAHYDDLAPDIVDLYLCDNAAQARVTALRGALSVELPSYYRPELAQETGDKYAVFGAATEPILRLENDLRSSKNLLLLTDSYGASMIPFLTQHYRTVTAVNLELIQDSSWKDIAGTEQTQILLLCSTETLTSDCFSLLQD